MNQNWIVENLNSAFSTWNNRLTELWSLATTSPETFKGGTVWSVMQGIHSTLLGVGYGLLILFFAIALFKNTANFHELRRPEAAIHYLIRFVAAKALVGYGMEIMLKIFSICNGVVLQIAGRMSGISQAMVHLPGEIQTAIEEVGFRQHPVMAGHHPGQSVYSGAFLYYDSDGVRALFQAVYVHRSGPLPLSTFAGESTQSVGIAFLKSYVGVCLEGAVIVLACIIYAGFVNTPSVGGGEATTMVWSYLAETVFNMLVLVGLIKGSDRIIHEMMGL